MKKILITLLLVSLYLTANSQIKISQLTEATSINTTDLFLLSKGDASRKLQFSTLKNSIFNPINYPLRVLYSGDSIRIGLSGDDAILATSKNLFRFNKPLYYNNNILSTVAQLHDTANVLRNYMLNNSFSYTKSLDSSVYWNMGEYEMFGINDYGEHKSAYIGGENPLFRSFMTSEYTGNFFGFTDKTSGNYLSSVLHNEHGFQYYQQDTSLFNDSSFVTSRWVKDRLGSSGQNSILTASVTISSIELKNNTAVQIIPAQAVGKMAVPLNVILKYNFGSIAYTSNEFTLGLTRNSAPAYSIETNLISSFLTSTNSKSAVSQVRYTADLSNEAIYVSNLTDSTENGDGTLTVILTYMIIDI